MVTTLVMGDMTSHRCQEIYIKKGIYYSIHQQLSGLVGVTTLND